MKKIPSDDFLICFRKYMEHSARVTMTDTLLGVAGLYSERERLFPNSDIMDDYLAEFIINTLDRYNLQVVTKDKANQ